MDSLDKYGIYASSHDSRVKLKWYKRDEKKKKKEEKEKKGTLFGRLGI